MIIHIKRIGSMKLYVSRSERAPENPDVNALLEDSTIKSQLEKSQ